ncbi:MAG: hypothetical protein G01um101449_468 [Parcubacteria group bacterium Gr01-1014_49]|nr:MAG: hypothetical protein G01um101449_468 [Parcubacteria group bacterium Gr01-1014_49]
MLKTVPRGGVPTRRVSTRTRSRLPATTRRRKEREALQTARQFTLPPRAPASFVSEAPLPPPFPRPLQVFFLQSEEVIIERMERGVIYAEAS